MPVYEYGHAQEIVVNNGEKIVDNIVDYENINGDLMIKGRIDGHKINEKGPYSSVLQRIMQKNKSNSFRDTYAKESANYEIGDFPSSQKEFEVMMHSNKKTKRKLTKRRKRHSITKKHSKSKRT